MEDLSQRISELLSDPSTMEQIKSLTGLFGQGSQNTDEKASVSRPAQQQENSLLGSMTDPGMLNMMMKIAPLMQSLQGDDDSTRLLRALKPFMHEERAKRIDGAIRLLHIMKLMPMLKTAGIELLPK